MTLEEEYFRDMLRIRRFEETVLEEFKRGVFSGTTHTSIGQEADAVGVIRQLLPDDIILTNHRCHGHFLAYGGDMRALFAELMGRQTGICGGRGGSQHIHYKNLYSNGVQGGIVPIAVGMALAEKQKKSEAAVVVFIGDGTLGEGVVYEAFNMASLWSAPLLIVVENNHIAQTTPTEYALAGDVRMRFQAFGIPALELDTSSVMEIAGNTFQLMREVHEDYAPRALVLNTQRFGPHSKGDDTRSEQVVALLKEQRDPITLMEKQLSSASVSSIRAEVEQQVKTAFETALADPVATMEGRA
ncbi:MAG: thiamine pyrophosphate-dependent dehydrogenase E1 component subunit alpha [Anaerolineaceae bacterium]|nr:thiamine pyrophosphate-dependent dehydrogenase E1 component subunit alpha [Anaerolineaceae bacterium]